jgi:hypothetical protein
LTSRPVKGTDIAISFSKIPAPDNKKQIVLEVSCMQEEAGVTYCKTPKVKDIRKNYLEYLKLRLTKN